MGQDQSKKKSLAETRYKVDRPKKRAPRGVVVNETVQPKVDRIKATANELMDALPTIEGEQLSPDGESGPDMARRSPSPRLEERKRHFLTKRERILLQHSWKKTRKTGAEHVGSKIFLMVLTAQPDIKAIFGMEKIPQGRLKYDPRFRQHATVFTKTFDYVMKNIDYAEKLETHFESVEYMLQSLGRKHVVMQGRGFDPQFWETFAECMTQAAVEWEASRQKLTISAWRTLVSTIIMYMRRGFDEDNAKRRSSHLRAPPAAAPKRIQPRPVPRIMT